MFDILVEMKKTDNPGYNTMMKWSKIDVCKLATDITAFLIVRDFLDFVSIQKESYGQTDSILSLLPSVICQLQINTMAGGNLIHKCPYNGISLNFSMQTEVVDPNSHSGFPNGEFKTTVKIYNNRDKNIGTVKIYFEQRNYRFLL